MAENAKDTKKRRFGFRSIAKFFREVWAELKRVSWPSRKELVTYTIAVFVFVIVIAAFVGVLDLIFAQGMRLIVG